MADTASAGLAPVNAAFEVAIVQALAACQALLESSTRLAEAVRRSGGVGDTMAGAMVAHFDQIDAGVHDLRRLLDDFYLSHRRGEV